MKSTLFSRRRIFIFFIIILAGIASALAVNKLSADKNPARELLGKEFSINAPLPEMKLPDFETNVAREEELKQGKVLLVYFVTGCFGCQKESEILSQIDLAKSRGIKVYGIADQDIESVRVFIREHDFRFPVLLDMNHKFRESLKIDYFPANFLIKDGRILKIWYGNPKDEEDLYKKLDFGETK